MDGQAVLKQKIQLTIRATLAIKHVGTTQEVTMAPPRVLVVHQVSTIDAGYSLAVSIRRAYSIEIVERQPLPHARLIPVFKETRRAKAFVDVFDEVATTFEFTLFNTHVAQRRRARKTIIR